MVKKKVKSGKKQKRKGGREDVKASSSLPPSVDGQLRCFLRITTSKISWLMAKPPDVFFLRLKWWGEHSNGSMFRPSDGREEGKSSVRKTARYPIRCGPKQFADYLNAMSTCVFELLKGQQMVCIGKATISELGLLAPQKPISGVYPIFSNQKAEKLAEVNVSMKFEPLPVSYDSSSSVPTTDVSLPTQQGHTSTIHHHPSILKKQRKSSSVRSSSSYQPPSSDIDGGKKDGRTPSGVDDDYSFVIGPGAGGHRKLQVGDTRGGKEKRAYQPYVKLMPDSTMSVTDTETDIFSSSQVDASRRKLEVQPTSDAGKHLISAILEKGNRLMDSMIRAQCESQPMGPSLEGLKIDPSLESPRQDRVHPPLRRSSSGELFRELLKGDKSSFGFVGGIAEGKEDKEMVAADPTLDLVLTDVITDKELHQVETMLGRSPADSIDSDFNDVIDGLTTDSDDPLHEHSILEELFYKRQVISSDSDGGLSDILLSSDSETEVVRKKEKYHRESQGKMRISRADRGNESKGNHERSTMSERVEEDRDARGEREEKEKETSEDDSLDTSSVASLLHSSINGIEGLSVQRLTLLGRVNAARVVIDTLTLFQGTPREAALGATSRIPRRIADNAAIKGKPPRPQIKSTYFVEYQFPIVATGQDSDYMYNTATEIMRVVSKKVTENKGISEIQFGHRSIFPIQFDGSTVDHWWTRLLVLRIFHKVAGQKTPSLIAVASLPLKKILQSPGLSVVMDLSVKRKDYQDRRDSSSSLATESTPKSPDNQSSQLGQIQLSVELTSDSKDFKTALARTKLAEMKGAKLISLPTLKNGKLTSKDLQRRSSTREVRVGEGVGSSGRGVRSPQGGGMHHQRMSYRGADMKGGGPLTGSQQSTNVECNTGSVEEEYLTLFTLLLIPEGRGITIQGVKPLDSRNDDLHITSGLPRNFSNGPSAEHGRDFVTRNTYLVCKMFWSDDAVHSNVCWGTSLPQFNFSQVAPVLLTPSLLERTRDNFMVVEVWDKKTSGQNDVLIGMAKLPLHQFYLSFRDQKVANAILKSQYPVVGIDTYAPVINPFTGVQYGQIKVLLAMGAFHQITTLQRLKGDMTTDIPNPEKPFHYLERSEQTLHRESQPVIDAHEDESQEEHIFEVVIEGVRSLPQGEEFVWGEADCFVQYHFPSQEKQFNQIQGSLGLKSFRSATTLCLPDPMFNEVTRHRISLPLNVPVQRELLTACVGVGGAAGCIPFELWCRYYYPNVREQVIAKASMPLAKLCAMVTMQRRGEPSIQTFNLPLRTMLSEEDNDQVTSGGFLDVTVSYKHSTIRQGLHLFNGLSTVPQVSLTVSVLRATGLQAAAKSLARYQPSLQYASDVGLNTFITVHLSFLPKEEIKRSGTIARSFSPEVSHHMDISCPLILQSGGQEMSLAEALEMADLEVKVWHQGQHSLGGAMLHADEDNSISGRQIVAPPSETLLGSVCLPLKHLLLKRMGIHGWFTINIPTHDHWTVTPQQDYSSEKTTSTKPYSCNMDGGSVELAIKFARKMDREKVLEVGQRMGWSSAIPLDEYDDFSEGSALPVTVSIQVDRILFNKHLFLRLGQSGTKSNCQVYIRYQFYDKRPTCSSPCLVRQGDDGYLSADNKHTQHIKLTTNPSFNWYLKEEQFEIQVWVSQDEQFPLKKESRSKKADRLIGSAHIDLVALAIDSGSCRSISGLFPLSKPGVDNMYSACLRGSISLVIGHQQQMVHSSTDEEGSAEEIEGVTKDMKDEKEIPDEVTEITNPPPPEPLEEVIEPLPFQLHIERAMGLCTSPQRWNSTPLNTYVTLQVDESSSLITSTVVDSIRPVWNHYQELVLDPQEVIEKQHLIFKVWHQTTGRQDISCDRMIGFTSIDLGPLLVGFRSLNGWYNIVDFSSQVKGQIKIAITPKRDMSMLKKQAVLFMSHMTSTNTSGHMQPMHSSHPYHYPSLDNIARHHEKHVRGVRESHERLHTNRRSWEKAMDDPSLSLLKENLRKNLADLDSLKEKLDHKRRCLDGVDSDDGGDHLGTKDFEQGKVQEMEEVGYSTTQKPPLPGNSEMGTGLGVNEPLRGQGGSSEVGMGLGVNEPLRDQVDLTTNTNVQYHQTGVRMEEELEEENVASESLEDSGSECESSIVIPRTLNDILPDDRTGAEGARDCEEGLIDEDEAGVRETRSETHEEALERIQKRILQVVVGSGEIGKDDEQTKQRKQMIDESESLGVEVRGELLSLRESDEDGSILQEEDDGDSELSRSFSQPEEEAASFASSRDEGDGSNPSPRIGTLRRSSHDVNVDEPFVGLRDEMEAITGTEEEFEWGYDERSEQPKMKMDHGGIQGMDTLSEVRVTEQGPYSVEVRRAPPTESSKSSKVPDHKAQEKDPTKATPLAFELPNFFLPSDDLASAMRTLDSAVSRPTIRSPEVGSLSERIQAAREVARRMEEAAKVERPPGQVYRPKKYARTQPTADEAKRIAKIFSAKYSSS